MRCTYTHRHYISTSSVDTLESSPARWRDCAHRSTNEKNQGWRSVTLVCKIAHGVTPSSISHTLTRRINHLSFWAFEHYASWLVLLQNKLLWFILQRCHYLDGPVVRVSGYRSIGPGFDSRRFQIFWEAEGLERGPLRLVRTTEELLEGKSSGSGLENLD
jgi:hypothetical protein